MIESKEESKRMDAGGKIELCMMTNGVATLQTDYIHSFPYLDGWSGEVHETGRKEERKKGFGLLRPARGIRGIPILASYRDTMNY